jgi:acyl carrier protein
MTQQHRQTLDLPANDARDRVRELVVRLAPTPADVANADLRLADELGYDSLSFMEMAFMLETELGIELVDTFDDGSAGSIEIVRDVEDRVIALLDGVARR